LAVEFEILVVALVVELFEHAQLVLLGLVYFVGFVEWVGKFVYKLVVVLEFE
jgi:hypothetical protein